LKLGALQGTRWILILKYSPAFRKAACAVSGKIISGSVIPLSWYPLCRALKQAMRIDSVPPLVVTPAAPSGALKRDRT